MFNWFKKKEKIKINKIQKIKISVLFKDGDEIEYKGNKDNTFISSSFQPFTVINVGGKAVFYKSENIDVIVQELIKEEINE